MDEIKNVTPLNDDQLNEASGGVKIGPGGGGQYHCPKCGYDDFIVNSVQNGQMFVTCKRCGQQATCSAVM